MTGFDPKAVSRRAGLRWMGVTLLWLTVLGAAALSPHVVPFDMDEFAAYHVLGCSGSPLTRQYNSFREGCGQYDLQPPLLPWSLPLRSYIYIGSPPVAPFYPFWMLLQAPVAARIQGAVFLLVAVHLIAWLLRQRLVPVLLAALLFPLFAGAFVVDTGPVGISIALLLGAALLLRQAVVETSWPAAVAAGLLVFVGIWIKLVFAWCLPALGLLVLREAIERGASVPLRTLVARGLGFLLAAAVPTLGLLYSTTEKGVPYLNVLRKGSFSVETESLQSVAGALLGHLVTGSSFAPRTLVFEPSALDLLPLALAACVLVAGVRHGRGAAIFWWLAAAAITFGVMLFSGRARAAHHVVFAVLFLVLALADAIGELGVRARWVIALAIGVQIGSLAVRYPTAQVVPGHDFEKDALLASIRERGLDRTLVQLHSAWGTYYIAHLFGDPQRIVLFSKKFATTDEFLQRAGTLATAEGRGVLLIADARAVLERPVVLRTLGPPLRVEQFGTWCFGQYLR